MVRHNEGPVAQELEEEHGLAPLLRELPFTMGWWEEEEVEEVEDAPMPPGLPHFSGWPLAAMCSRGSPLLGEEAEAKPSSSPAHTPTPALALLAVELPQEEVLRTTEDGETLC